MQTFFRSLLLTAICLLPLVTQAAAPASCPEPIWGGLDCTFGGATGKTVFNGYCEDATTAQSACTADGKTLQPDMNLGCSCQGSSGGGGIYNPPATPGGGADMPACAAGKILQWKVSSTATDVDFDGDGALCSDTTSDTDDDLNGDANCGNDAGWACVDNVLGNTLALLSDTNVTTCAVGQVLTWTTNDNGTPSNVTDDFEEWQCQNVRWAGITSAVNGNRTNYAGSDNLCNAAYSGSRVCSSTDLIRVLAAGTSVPNGVNNQIWVNNGPPGYVATPSNDCAGWTSADSSLYGSVLATSPGGAKRFLISPCIELREFACCF